MGDSLCWWTRFTNHEGDTWTGPVETAARGIVPDRLLELASGRWIVSCHHDDVDFGYLVQRLWTSDDQGMSWSGPVIVGRQSGLNLCEVSNSAARGWDTGWFSS